MARKPATPKPAAEAQPQYKVEYREIQAFGTLKKLPLGLEDNARANRLLKKGFHRTF